MAYLLLAYFIHFLGERRHTMERNSYTPLASDEHIPYPKQQPIRTSYVTIALATLVTIATAIIVAVKTYRTGNIITTTVLSPDYCRTTHVSALEAKCLFDPISFSWTPQPCYDASLIDSFLALDDWTWYLDANGTNPVVFDVVITGSHEYLYVSWDYHRWHCTYMWRKMHRAILSQNGSGRGGEKLLLDTYINDPEHTEHCEGVLLNRTVPLGNTDTMIRRKFIGCVAT